MKLSQTVSPVETGEALGSPQSFQIAASKEAFRILSSGLYNNKIGAIIRELSCNAYDAHVAAGKKDVPFELHLPTAFEPFFSVRDDGVGLSHDEVLNLYTTYFGTNKSESNDYVGALGLGSKSPFCYTEGFTVTSRYQGVTRIYSCYIDERGMPAVLLQQESDTPDVCNGIEVQFPVKQDDVWEFENQAKTTLEFFDPKPIINTSLSINQQEYVLRTEKWGLRKESYTKQGLRAIQGMVQYNVGVIDSSRLDGLESVSSLPLDIFFSIGELSVAASRESLSNDEHTVGNILKSLTDIKEGILVQVKSDLAQCTTAWEARLKIHTLINTQGIGKITNEAFNRGELDGVYKTFGISKNKPSIKVGDYGKVDLYEIYTSYRSRRKYKMTSGYGNDEIPFDVAKSTIFVINDVGFGGEKYIFSYLNSEDNEYTSAVYITRRDKNVSVIDVGKQAKLILEKIGNPPSILLSELKATYQKEYKVVSTTPAPAARKILKFNLSRNIRHKKEGYSIQGWSLGWDDATNDVLPTGTKYYVSVSRLEPQTAHFQHAEQFQNFVKAVQESKLLGFTETDTLYGLPKDSSLIKQKGWVEFTSYVFNKLKSVMTPEYEKAVSESENPFSSGFDILLRKIARGKLLSPTSPMQIFCNEIQTFSSINENQIANLLIVVRKAVSEGKYKLKVKLDYNVLWEAVVREYPLLSNLNSVYYESQKIDNYINYFRLVDDAREVKLQQHSNALVVTETVYSNNQENENVEDPVCSEN